MTQLIKSEPRRAGLATLSAEGLGDKALNFARSSRAKSTQRVYAGSWRAFTAWAQGRGESALPATPATVADYLAELAEAGSRYSTLNVKRAAISSAHKIAGHPDPCQAEAVTLVLAGIGRTIGTAAGKKAPATIDVLRRLVASLDTSTAAGRRDRALLLLGFAGAFRRSELVALDVADLRFGDDALRVTVRRSKTDQTGQGMIKTIPSLKDESLCPVRAVRAWLDLAAIKSGPVFRRFDRWGHIGARLHDQAVAKLIKRQAVAAGLDPRQYAGHSLRAGFVTSAVLAGAEALDVAEQTGHRSLDVLRGYVRSAGKQAKRATIAAFSQSRKHD